MSHHGRRVYSKQDIRISDKTGTIKMILYNTATGSVKKGRDYFFSHVKKCQWNSSYLTASGYSSRITVAKVPLTGVSNEMSDDEENPSSQRVLTGVIQGKSYMEAFNLIYIA